MQSFKFLHITLLTKATQMINNYCTVFISVFLGSEFPPPKKKFLNFLPIIATLNTNVYLALFICLLPPNVGALNYI